jgi:hypothetical protein
MTWEWALVAGVGGRKPEATEHNRIGMVIDGGDTPVHDFARNFHVLAQA